MTSESDLANAPLTKKQARTVLVLSSSMTESLLNIAKEADAAFLRAAEMGAPPVELAELARHGLEAAEHLHSNMATVMYASMRKQEGRWRSKEKVEQRVRSSLGPHVDQAAAAIATWKERVARHAQ